MSRTSVPKRSAIVAAIAAFAFTTTIPAQSASEGQSIMSIAGETLPAETLRESRFRFLDLDGDGFVKLDEIDPEDSVLRSQFDSLDWNNDGRLSEAEFVLNGRPQ